MRVWIEKGTRWVLEHDGKLVGLKGSGQKHRQTMIFGHRSDAAAWRSCWHHARRREIKIVKVRIRYGEVER